MVVDIQVSNHNHLALKHARLLNQTEPAIEE